MSNSTTEHTIDQDNCLACQEERKAPMTLPDDIELDNKILDLLEPHYENIGFTREHAKTSVTFREFKKLIATYRTKWETEARVDELEAISSPKFLRNIRTTITDSNGEVYTDDSHMYISKFEVQERILELKGNTSD